MRLTIALFFLSMSSLTNAQPIQLSPRVDYESSTLLGRDLNDFFTSYNDYYQSNLTSSFDSLRAGDFGHFNYGGALRAQIGDEKIAFCSGFLFTYGQANAIRSAAHLNGIKAQTDFKVNDYMGQFDIGFKLYIIQLSTHMAARYRKTQMAFGYYYQDGSYSIGNEYDILGVYLAETITLDVGFSIGLKYKRWYVPLSWSYATDAFSDDGLLTLVDSEKRQIRWRDVPRDFEQWATDPTNMNLETGFVRSKSLRSNRITLGIEYSLMYDRKKKDKK